MNLIEKIILRVIQHKVSNWFRLERSLTKLENVYKSIAESPEKSWPNPDKIPSGEEVPFSLKNIPVVGHSLKSCIHQGTLAIKTVGENPAQGKGAISAEELKAFEEYAKNQGIGSIGYAKLPQHLIFKERAVLYNYAIVLTMEMDKKAIENAPSVETFKMVMSTYDGLGIITNRLTEKLRNMGFQAQASHPLGGLVLYPPLAVEAGLGWFGRHGLLITPQFGPRQRISAIFINVENLPVAKVNPHAWIKDFCGRCGQCIKACPSSAILSQPITHGSGRQTQISREKCLPVFVKQEGCSICIKECVFTKIGYNNLYEKFKEQVIQ